VHRIGRTGRAGRKGDAILFMTPREKYLLRAIERATKQPVEHMHLPTAETVNSLRMSKFADQITETLESEDLNAFRDLIASYEEEHKVPAAEIAAALAVMAQGGKPLLVEELPATPEFQKRERNKDGFNSRGPSRSVTEGNATYRIAVGRRQRVLPGSIVGAIANEGGLSSSQIGGIDIRSDHTLVELPAELTKDQWAALSRTRIGGELIQLELDNGRRPNRERNDRGGDRGFGGGRGGNFKGNGGFKREFRKSDEGGFNRDRGERGGSDRGDRGGFTRDRGERSSADRGGRSYSERNERSYDRDSGSRGGYGERPRTGGYGERSGGDRGNSSFGQRKPRHGKGDFGGRNKW